MSKLSADVSHPALGKVLGTQKDGVPHGCPGPTRHMERSCPGNSTSEFSSAEVFHSAGVWEAGPVQLSALAGPVWLKHGPDPAQQQARNWLGSETSECAIVVSSFLSSPISSSEEGTKMRWENMLFHWVKIYHQGNDFAVSQKGRREAFGKV